LRADRAFDVCAPGRFETGTFATYKKYGDFHVTLPAFFLRGDLVK